MLNLTAVKKIAYIYLLIPFILFAMGWLNWIAAVLVCIIVFAGFISIWRTLPSKDLFEFRKADFILTLVILGVWVFLSGVGGYTFQNWDHHSRNAVFRDLINYPWPVVYHFQPDVSAQFGIPSTLIMSYYFGFWLPSALVGKLWGWNIANFSLFFWTYFGIAMAIILTATKLRISFLKTALLIIFFSGMDFVGVILFKNIRGYTYPLLWPPIQHLEWWTAPYQYSSFTTDLYWTYNQFVPALLIMALFVTSSTRRPLLWLGGICFFFAPFPALGMIPFFGGSFLSEAFVLLRGKSKRLWLSSFACYFLTFENIAGVVLGVVSALFFITNLAVQTQSFGLPASISYYIVFLLLECMLIWLILLPANKTDWMWYVAGAVLILAPFICFGGTWDFMMRATIPALYILSLGCLRFLITSKTVVVRVLLIFMLLAGALTPIYEMNRSIVRTAAYYDPNFLSAIHLDRYFQHAPVILFDFVPEFDHPKTLVADDWVSISIPRGDAWNTKVGTLFKPIFQYLWKSNLIDVRPSP